MKKINEIEESFSQKFTEFLEFHLCDTFRNSEKKEIRRLWCDGIVWNHYSKKSINDKREIETMAWIGQSGQDEFEMKIKFGKYSLRRYAKGTALNDCVPNSDSMDWIEIDIENRRIQLQLK